MESGKLKVESGKMKVENEVIKQDFNQVYSIIDIHRKRAFQEKSKIVPFETAQIPQFLLQINWTCHQQILNGCKTNEQRIFYILYAKSENFEVKELQRAIKTNAYESVLGSGDFKSVALKNIYPESSLLLKDTAYLEFLGLPKRYKESRLRKGIVSHMKDFILELGKDFLFVDEEHCLEVGGKTFKCDLLFYHRGL